MLFSGMFILLFLVLVLGPIGAVFLRFSIAILNRFLPKFIDPATVDSNGGIAADIAQSRSGEGQPERDLSNPYSAPVETEGLQDPYAASVNAELRGDGAIPRVTFLRGTLLSYLNFFCMIAFNVVRIPLDRDLFGLFDVGEAFAAIYYALNYCVPVLISSLIAWRGIPTTFWRGVGVSVVCHVLYFLVAAVIGFIVYVVVTLG